METKYRLKKEARQFFKEKLHKEIHVLKTWKEYDVTEPLLEEVELVHIEYGTFPRRVGESSSKSASLCGHSGNEKEAHFEFHFIINDIDWKDYDRLNKDSFIAEWMDELQKVTNKLIKTKVSTP